MKKRLSMLFTGIVFLSSSVASAYSFNYTVTQLTHDTYSKSGLRINSSGEAVWSGYVPTQADIFIYDGSQIVQLTTSANQEFNDGPSISENGHIAWVWENPYTNPQKRKILYYNGITTSVIADPNNMVSSPSINNDSVIWTGRIGSSSSSNSEIWLYNGSTTTRLTDNSYRDDYPKINRYGQAVWVGWVPYIGGSEIFYFDGSSVTRLTNNGQTETDPQINDNGYVVWQKQKTSTTYDIYLFDGMTTRKLTTVAGDGKFPQINSSGHVVWHGFDGSDNEIFFYDGTSVTQLTDNSFDDVYPDINDKDYIVWRGNDGNDDEIFFDDGSITLQITDNAYDDGYVNAGVAVQVDANGNIFWIGYNGTQYQVFVATSPPSVISTTPADNAIDITVDSVITATFSEGMTSSTINTNSFSIDNGVSGTVSYDSNTTTATFTPTVDLNYDTTYTATITTGVEDYDGNQLQSDFSWSFTTGPAPDVTPPAVNSHSPVIGANGVLLDSTISVTFTEDMDPLTIDINTFTVNNGVSGAISYDVGTRTATFNPSANLAYSTTYIVTVTTGVKDLALNPLQTAYTWSFTTVSAPDTTPPVVESTSPDDNETDVPVDSVVSVIFSEDMDAATIDSNALHLDNGVTCSVSYDAGSRTATLTPLADFNEDTTYTLMVTTGARDMAGNALQVGSTCSFTTISETVGNGDSGGSGRSGGCFINTILD